MYHVFILRGTREVKLWSLRSREEIDTLLARGWVVRVLPVGPHKR